MANLSFLRGSSLAALILVSSLYACPAQAEVQACVTAHEEAQVARKEGRLLEAQEHLLTCARDACPSILRKDCGPWLTEVGSSIPTVVVLAKGPEGTELLNVRVLFEGKEIVATLDGRAIQVDPGVRVFRFESEGHDAVEREVVVREGIKNQEIVVQFGRPSGKRWEEPSTSTAEEFPEGDERMIRPTPTLVYVLGGVGLAGLATSVYFQTSGLSKRSDLDAMGCKPTCPRDEVDAAKRDILVGDIALGIGVASLGAATYFYFARPTVAEPSLLQPRVDVHGTRGGAMAWIHTRF